MDMGVTGCEFEDTTELLSLIQANEQQFQTTLNTPLQIREQVEEGMKRAIPAMVEAMKGTRQTDQIQCQCKQELMDIIPVMVETMFSKFHQDLKVSIPAMVGEILQKMSQNPISRSLPHDADSPVLRTLQLIFVGTLPDSFLTLNNITTEEGAPLLVELVDMSESKVEVGPESSAKIKIVVLDGDFEVDNREENFNEKVVKPRKDKAALLKGKCDISLKTGVATVSDLAFTDNSKSMRNGHFRLGAQIVEVFPGVAIKEAVSKAFKVKERRLQSCGKEKKPSLDNNIRCLKHIGLTISQGLAGIEVHTVKDFLQLYNTDAKALRKNLRITDKKWSEIIDNAKSCSLTKECYQYHDDTEGVDVVLDCVFNIVSVTFKGQSSHSFETLDDSHKELANKIRRNAYEKRSELQPTIIRTCQTSVQVEPLHPWIPQINMYHAGATLEPGQQEMLPNFNCFAPGVSVMPLPLPLPSQPGRHIDETQDLYPELQNMSMSADWFSDDFGSQMASTSNTRATVLIHEADELKIKCRARWKSVQFVFRMFVIAGMLSVKQGFRAQKRQKLG